MGQGEQLDKQVWVKRMKKFNLVNKNEIWITQKYDLFLHHTEPYLCLYKVQHEDHHYLDHKHHDVRIYIKLRVHYIKLLLSANSQLYNDIIDGKNFQLLFLLTFRYFKIDLQGHGIGWV